ncbi:MAG: imidazolonepropionase [Polaribacter sp.]|jgi:imidazolonepropionase
MSQLFVNIKELLQVRNLDKTKVSGDQMNELPSIQNAYLWVENGLIKDYGSMDAVPEIAIEQIDCTHRLILPTWCDSHTHLVFGDTREDEFVDRINGLTYEEIANKGGGILNSAKKLESITEDELYKKSLSRLQKAISTGTGAIEIKSGYGLSVEGELKLLRVIKRLKENSIIPIKATFLGAHAIPTAYKSDPENYIDLIINKMLPVIAEEELADFIDVFCEKGYFNPSQMNRILKAGKDYGLVPKVHVNQFNSIGGIESAIKNNALSVDHLEVLTDSEIDSLANSTTIPVALPVCSLFLSIPYTPARKIIDKGLPLAIASDFNPGSAPSSNLNLALSLACIKMNMTPEEAINALTLNGAYAMNLASEVGSITKGKKANFMITEPIKNYHLLPYSFGSSNIESVYINGTKQE